MNFEWMKADGTSETITGLLPIEQALSEIAERIETTEAAGRFTDATILRARHRDQIHQWMLFQKQACNETRTAINIELNRLIKRGAWWQEIIANFMPRKGLSPAQIAIFADASADLQPADYSTAWNVLELDPFFKSPLFDVQYESMAQNDAAIELCRAALRSLQNIEPALEREVVGETEWRELVDTLQRYLDGRSDG